MLREEMCKNPAQRTLVLSAWGSTETPLPSDPESRNSAWSGGAAELCLQAVLRGEKPAVALEK